ncbi:MAG: ATP-binding protein [Myxococcota bacterium]|nr:ATP-binding protein [Myxococcota bacterium]
MVVWLAVVSPTLALWWAAGRELEESARQAAEGHAVDQARRLEDFVAARVVAGAALARALELDPPTTEADFAAPSRALLGELEGLRALNWVAPDGTIVWVQPEAANADASEQNVLRHPRAAGPAGDAIRSHRPRRTPFLRLFQGGTGFAVYFPVLEAGRLRGLLNAVFDLEGLAAVLSHARGGAIRLREGGEIVYRTEGEPVDAPALATRSLFLLDEPVQLEVTRAPGASPHGWVRHLLLALGALLGLFAAGRVSRWVARNQAVRARLSRERRSKAELRGLSRALIEAQERERAHLARELHDEVGQSLTLAKLVAAEARQGHLSELDALERSVDEALEAVRRISRDLHPNVLRDLGLVPGLRALVLKVEARTHVTIEGRWPARVDVPEATALCLYRVAQEAITNALKHASPSRVEVKLEETEDGLMLRVEDDGVGFDGPAPQGTTGLTSMRERAAMCGGRLSIDGRPGAGTTVTLRLPRQATH